MPLTRLKKETSTYWSWCCGSTITIRIPVVVLFLIIGSTCYLVFLNLAVTSHKSFSAFHNLIDPLTHPHLPARPPTLSQSSAILHGLPDNQVQPPNPSSNSQNEQKTETIVNADPSQSQQALPPASLRKPAIDPKTAGHLHFQSESQDNISVKKTSNNQNNNNKNKNKKNIRSLSPNKPQKQKQTQSEAIHSEKLKGITMFKRFYSFQPKDRNLILGIATNTDPKYLAIFAGSLRERVKSTATVILFINSPIHQQTKELAIKYNLILIDFHVIKDNIQPFYIQKYHPSSLRWIFYYQLIMGNLEFFEFYFDKVIVLDVRDSVFQSDPFQLIPNHSNNPRTGTTRINISPPSSSSWSSSGAVPIASPIAPAMMNSAMIPTNSTDVLYVFGENQITMIKDCGWNSGWIRDCFDDNGLNLVGNNFVICSGISMGNLLVIHKYLEIMHHILLGYQVNQKKELEFISDVSKEFKKDSSSKFPSCERNGVDQGIHNYILHGHFYPYEIAILYPETFPILNLQASIDLYQPSPTDMSTINNFNGQPFAIVHQYDRNYPFQMTLASKYVYWLSWKQDVNGGAMTVMMNNMDVEWRQTEECKSFQYSKDLDLFRGQCDMGVARVMTPASCCSVCQQRGKNFNHLTGNYGQNERDCTAFTYVNGVCYLKDCNKDAIGNALRNVESSKNNPMLLQTLNLMENGAISGYIR